MLTKEERNAIAERARENLDVIENMYEVLFGHEVPDSTSWVQDCEAVKARLIDLCNTPNMVELPLDKNGQTIRAGDIVYDEAGRKVKVDRVQYYKDNVFVVVILRGSEHCVLMYRPSELAHKNPVTPSSLAEKIRDILKDDDDMSTWTNSKLSDIADQLEKLGDSDD